MKTKLLAIICAVLALVSCSQDRVIRVKTPARPAGQQDVIGLTAEPIDTVRIGFIGLGMRGSSAVYRFARQPFTKIVALCDVEPDRIEHSQANLRAAGLPEAAAYSGSEEV